MMMMAGVLVGCASQPLTGLFRSSDSGQVTGSVSAPVAFQPVIGAPAKVGEQLTNQLKAAAGQQNVTIAAAGDKPVYHVQGYLAASPEGNQSKIAYIWDVTDSDGKRVHRIAGEELVASKGGNNPWAGLDQATMDKIANKTASDLSAWLPKTAAPQPVAASTPPSGPRPAPADKAASGEVLTYVPAVTGAPGDGQRSLTLAIKKQLFKKGIKITSTSGSAAHTVKGSVAVTQAAGNKEAITIKWEVLDPSGRLLGTVSQKNTIATGSLNGNWGPTADAAASAATDGILKLLPKPRT